MAAEFSPDGAEGFAYAVLASASNLSYQIADKVGSFLYQQWFGQSLTPLIVISVITTALAATFLPFLQLAKSKPPARD